ncbi:MAG: DciA family protein [Steroidobacteraceae bacterium]
MASIADQASRQRIWRQWLAERLPASLVARVTGVVERDGELVIFTESAGWGVRLRYALAELDTELHSAHPAVTRVAVRVLPKGTPG